MMALLTEEQRKYLEAKLRVIEYERKVAKSQWLTHSLRRKYDGLV